MLKFKRNCKENMVREGFTLILLLAGIFAFTNLLFSDSPNVSKTSKLRVYPDRFDPAEHPDRGRLAVTPPDWADFDGMTQFITLRSFPVQDDVGKDFEKTLDQYQTEDLGRVIWPHSGTIFFKNLDELANIIKERDLYLFDLWGYVPGSGPRESGDWTQFRPDPAQLKILEEKLGRRWLGMDNGEQDGRYIGGYASQNRPVSGDRFEQYLRFQRHFERLGDDLGNRLATLVSLNFGHYFLKEGIYTLIGAETAQGLPNAQVYYSWIRGAGKQYGVLWFGNASIWNRWGWKDYNGTPTETSGPTKGTSLSLLKRLLYAHILYNSAAVGFENGWFVGDKLGAIGQIQKSAAHWLRDNGDPGTMMTPVAILTDFGSGWSFPRHLYTGFTYRVWGTIPYDAGDYLTDNVFQILYPGYRDSSYFHDETGFLTPTPYGDAADTLLTDAPAGLINRYALVLAAGRLTPSEELRDKLTDYVSQGGRILITAGNIAQWKDGLLGISVANDSGSSNSGNKKRFDAGTVVKNADGSESAEMSPFDLLPLVLPENAKILARCGETIAAAEVPCGKGSVIVLASEFGIGTKRAVSGPVLNEIDRPLPTPYPLLTHAQKIIEDALAQTVLFDVGEGLGSIVCRKGSNLWTIGVFNNSYEAKKMNLVSHIGAIESVRELPVDNAERSAIGFLPEAAQGADLGTDTAEMIAGSSVRIFEVRLCEETVSLIPPAEMPTPPKDRFLTLRGQTPIKEAILARPTFFQHFDGVCVDWRYFDAASEEELQRQAGWIKRQGLRLAVDFSSGVNLFPDLRLIQNDPEEYAQSQKTMESVIEKAAILGAETLLLATHRVPENNYSSEQTEADTCETLRHLSRFAAERRMNVFVRCQLGTNQNSPEAALALAEQVGEPNFRLAVSPGISNRMASSEQSDRGKIAAFLASGYALDDNNNTVWSEHLPIDQSAPEIQERVREGLRHLQDSNPVIIFDAVYHNADEEYRDVRLLEKVSALEE